MSDLDTVSLRESQDWVKAKLAPLWKADPDYCEDNDRSLVGEDDRGDILAARPGSDDWWEPFDLMKPEHVAAAEESLRRGQINFLDLDRSPDA